MDYFNNVFNNFSGPASFDPLEAYRGVIQLSDLFRKILISVPKMNESLTGLNNMRESKLTEFSFWGELAYTVLQIKLYSTRK